MPRYDQCDGTCTADCGHCKGQGPPDYVLVTFLVTRDGEQGHPMDTIVKRVNLTRDGQPVAIARLTEAIVREIGRKAHANRGEPDGP